MYRDEQEALRARVRSLEAQLNAEARRREAAEAEAEAARALAYEHKLKADGLRSDEPPIRPAALAAIFWPLALLMAVSTVASLYLGAWHARVRAARLRPVVVKAHTTSWQKCPHLRAHLQAAAKRHPELKKAVTKEPRYTTVRRVESKVQKSEPATLDLDN